MSFAPGFPGGLPTADWPPASDPLRDLAVAATLETQGVDGNYRENGETTDWPLRIRIQRTENLATGEFFNQGLSAPKYFPVRPQAGGWITVGTRVWEILNAQSEPSRVILELVEKTA